MLCTTTVLAHDFEVDGIYYNYVDNTNKTVEVTYYADNFENQYGYGYYGAITIPEFVTYDRSTFQVTRIGASAFDNCTGLTNIKIPNSVTSIGFYAFFGCSSLTNIEIPNSVENIGAMAFWGTSWWNNQKDGIVYLDNWCLGRKNITPMELYINEGTKGLVDYAFSNCTSLTNIDIPNSVTSIGSSAFYGCTGLTSITIPNSVTSIGSSAFEGCINLKTVLNRSSLVLNEGSDMYGYIAYYADMVINNYDGRIGDFIFTKENDIYYLHAYLGDDTELVLPETYNGNNYSIDAYAFYYNTNLTSIIIPNSVSSIGKAAFEGCTNLKTILNSSSLKITKGSSNHGYIAHYANLVVNNYDGKVDDYIFTKVNGNYYLYLYLGNDNELVLPQTYKENNYKIDSYLFYKYTNLTNIEIPNSVTSIGDVAFYGCTGLTSITIPNSVTSIGQSAFEGCI